MEEDDSEGGSNDIPMLDAGAGDAGEEQDYTTLPELAVKYPSFVLKQDWAPASRSISPETHMVDIFVNSLDPGRVLDHRTLFKTCRLLQLGGLPLMEKKLIENETSIPKKLADFVKQCSDVKGVPFNFAEVAKDWRDACVDIKEGGGLEVARRHAVCRSVQVSVFVQRCYQVVRTQKLQGHGVGCVLLHQSAGTSHPSHQTTSFYKPREPILLAESGDPGNQQG
jgi:hypothetical protein